MKKEFKSHIPVYKQFSRSWKVNQLNQTYPFVINNVNDDSKLAGVFTLGDENDTTNLDVTLESFHFWFSGGDLLGEEQVVVHLCFH